MTGFGLAAAIALSVAKAPGLPATAVATVKTAMAVRAIRLFMATPALKRSSCGAALKAGFHPAEGSGSFSSRGQQGVEGAGLWLASVSLKGPLNRAFLLAENGPWGYIHRHPGR